MGAVQATSLLAKNNCDILIHINSHVPDEIPSYNRIKGFIDICEEHHIKHKLFLEDLGDTYDETRAHIKKIFNIIQKSYPGMRKGIFMANDTHANILINILMCEYGKFTDEYKVVGFDNSPIASEAIIPITTVGQQIDKIAYEAMNLLASQMNELKKRDPHPKKDIIHKKITPVLIKRDTCT